MSELKEAFREAARRQFAMVPAEEDLEWVFSSGFERKMRRIIRAQVHGYWNFANTTAKRIAIAAAIIVMLLSTAMAIKPIRERVIQFFIEVYEEYFEIRFGEKEKDDIDPTPKPMVRYTLTKLPEGYEEIDFVQFEHILWTRWKDQSGNKMTLKQDTGTNEITIDTSNPAENMFCIEDSNVICYQYDENSTYIWEQDGYIFHLSVFSVFSDEEVEQMIASLEKCN